MTEENKTIQAEYMAWRKNIQSLYSIVLNHSIEWPALSIQFYPDYQRNNNVTTQRLLISTHTSGQEQEYLEIVELNLPDTVDDAETEENFKYKIAQKIPVDVEVNKARYSYKSPNLIALRSDEADVLVYDSTKHLSKSKSSQPDFVLKGHSSGGYGLDWSPFDPYKLISSGEDKKVILHNINGKSSTFEKHKNVVNDISFNKINENIFVSVANNQEMILWDQRSNEPIRIKSAHSSDINCCEFNPQEEAILATGGSDSSIKIWDLRNLDTSLFDLNYHKQDITVVRWSPHMSNILASGSLDRRVILWDVNKTNLASEEGPSELLFIHGGHTNQVNDISWNPLEKWELVSTAEDNILQLWAKAVDESVVA